MRASTPLEIDGGAESESEPVWRCNLCGHETTTGKDMAGFPHPCADGGRGHFERAESEVAR